MGVNLALFILMPNLLQQSSAPAVFDEIIPRIDVIRIKKPDTAAERKAPKPPVTRKSKAPEPAMPQTINRKFSLAFEINTKLPAGSAALELPVAAINDQGLGLQNAFETGDLDQPLIVLTRMPPFYPLNAKRKGIEGWVNVKFIVNEQGRVEDVSVLGSRPPGLFEESVIRCMSGWRFKPGMVKGEAVRVWAETTVRFELE